jgi:hypothetical protein
MRAGRLTPAIFSFTAAGAQPESASADNWASMHMLARVLFGKLRIVRPRVGYKRKAVSALCAADGDPNWR